MSCSVNLVPLARIEARARARRRSIWLVVCGVSALLASAGWGVQRAAEGALARLASHVNTLEAQRAEVRRRLVADGARRAQMLERLHTVAAARRPQLWVGRLARLTREAPEGIFLTALSATAGASAPPSGPPVMAPPHAGPAAEGRNAAAPGAAARAPEPERHTVQIRGHAVDNAALLQFLNTLQKLPGWEKVELVQAAAEKFGGRPAVGFEFRCRTVEEVQ
ncbi:MAG: PilN domain-containing protein [Planctomycetota bacterium]